ncbi:MAG: hypothetical protein IPF92_15150 [Myxococcales bacterium]|nr:hypothetical protein [Myxococcales bacterium]
MGRRITAVVFALGCAAAVACANGVADLDDGGLIEPVEEEDAGTPVRDSATPPRDVALPPVVQVDSAPPPPVDAGTDSPVVVDSGTGDSGTGDAGTPAACASPNTCLGGTTMTAISGDTGSPTSRTTGTTSQWLKIRVSENDSGVFGAKLKVRLTLTSPSSANFDMRVYVANDGSSQKCTGVDRQTSATVGPDVASVEWGEGAVANGDDDDRWVTIEVFHVSGTCAAGQTWSLLAEGNK